MHLQSILPAMDTLSTHTPSTAKLVDAFGRHITYLRISITDRCNFRCFYCMSDDMTFLPRDELLSLEEINRVASAFIARGVRKIRITGGEPLVRRGVMDLFRSMGKHVNDGALDELTLTTNAVLLDRYADELYASGVRRVNISLDTLREETFARITNYGELPPVMNGIAAAKKAGLHVKINAVALRGVNDVEVNDLVQWCGDQGFDLTFIETMPLGEPQVTRTDHYLPLSQVKADMAKRWTLSELDDNTGGPSRYVRIKETGGRVGFITPLTHNFCEDCNRVRLTCTGTLYMCLGQDDSVDLRTPLRAGEGNEALNAAIDQAMILKPKGHDFVIEDNKPAAVARHMSVTGG